MHKFFDLGMSDPLTLGMASPLADRIEILARKRPVTRTSRAIAGSALLLAAALSAPLTIADNHPEPKVETRSVMVFSDGATWSTDGETKLKSGGAYEIITEDGEVSAYKISNGGKTKKRVDVKVIGSDTYRITLKDGEIVTFDKPDLSGLDGLDALDGLEGLKALQGLEGLRALEGLKGFEGLKGLEKLEGLSALEELEDFTFTGEFLDGLSSSDEEHVFIFEDGELRTHNVEGAKNSLREHIQNSIRRRGDGVRSMRVVRTKDGTRTVHVDTDDRFSFPEKFGTDLPDTVIRFGEGGLKVEQSIDHVERQLENAERQLERLSEDDDMSRDLKQALRDIAKAKKSLEKAQKDLEDRD